MYVGKKMYYVNIITNPHDGPQIKIRGGEVKIVFIKLNILNFVLILQKYISVCIQFS